MFLVFLENNKVGKTYITQCVMQHPEQHIHIHIGRKFSKIKASSPLGMELNHILNTRSYCLLHLFGSGVMA